MRERERIFRKSEQEGYREFHLLFSHCPSFSSGEGYSLESLTAEVVGTRKRSIKERFGSPHIRVDGTAGKVFSLFLS